MLCHLLVRWNRLADESMPIKPLHEHGNAAPSRMLAYSRRRKESPHPPPTTQPIAGRIITRPHPRTAAAAARKGCSSGQSPAARRACMQKHAWHKTELAANARGEKELQVLPPGLHVARTHQQPQSTPAKQKKRPIELLVAHARQQKQRPAVAIKNPAGGAKAAGSRRVRCLAARAAWTSRRPTHARLPRAPKRSNPENGWHACAECARVTMQTSRGLQSMGDKHGASRSKQGAAEPNKCSTSPRVALNTRPCSCLMQAAAVPTEKNASQRICVCARGRQAEGRPARRT